MPPEFFFLSEPLKNPAAPTVEELLKSTNITSAITNANFTLGNTPSTKENNMNTFRNTHDNKTLTIEGQAIILKTDGTRGIAARVKESDLTAIAASVLELYGAPEAVGSYGNNIEDFVNTPTSDAELLWQVYACLKALGIRAERKAAQEAEKAAQDAALQKEAEEAANAATLLQERKDKIALTFTGKYFSELGITKKALVNALATQQIALDEALKKAAK